MKASLENSPATEDTEITESGRAGFADLNLRGIPLRRIASIGLVPMERRLAG